MKGSRPAEMQITGKKCPSVRDNLTTTKMTLLVNRISIDIICEINWNN